MPVSVVAALMIITTVLLSACAQERVAMVDDRSSQYYGRDAGMAMAAQTPNYGSSIRLDFGTHQAARTDSISSAPLAAPTAFTASASRWVWPVEGQVTERFGKQAAGIANEGISIAAAEGTPIKAASAGEVAYVGSDVRDYGNMVIVRHSGGELTSYAHARNIIVYKGAKVAQGETLGYVGKSGNATAPQLHFAMREGTQAIDPISKLPSQMASR